MTSTVANISPLDLQRIRAAGELLQQLANGDDFNLPGANFKTRIKKQLGLLTEDLPWRGNYTSYNNYLYSCWDFFKNVFNCHTDHNEGLTKISANTNGYKVPDKLSNALQTLKNNTNNLDIYIHGSMAREDFTDFSDIDDLVIFNKQNFTDNFDSFAANIKTLRQAAIEYQCIDPLQHHGHWVFADIHLKTGMCEKMPPEVLTAGAIIVSGEGTLQFRRIDNPDYSKEIFNINRDCVVQLSNKLRSKNINADDLKLLCSGAALLPALVMQIQKRPTDKATAIDEFINNGPSFARKALLWTGLIRNDFGNIVNIRQLRQKARQLAASGLMRCEIYTQIKNSLPQIDTGTLYEHRMASEIFDKFAHWATEQTEQ